MAVFFRLVTVSRHVDAGQNAVSIPKVTSVAHHQNRQVGVRQHGLGDTAEQQFFQPAASVRAHDDQIGL